MTNSTTLSKLKAWGAGAPSPSGATLPWPRTSEEDILILAFVRMAGESSPWGVALGHPGSKPAYYSVPEPRDIDAQALFVRSFGSKILGHLLHPDWLDEKQRQEFLANPEALAQLARKRQLWVPGATHLDLLHFLDFRFTLARTGDERHLRELRAIGRGCGWLFRESTRPGQVRVFDATARLRQAFVFPAESPRQSHLGFLLGWFHPGDRAQRLAAAAIAERLPVGITMDPSFERETLAPLLASWNEARGQLATPPDGEVTPPEQAQTTPPEQAQAAASASATRIHEALMPELERRWTLTLQALRLLQDDPRPENPQLGPVQDLGVEEYQTQFWNDEARVHNTALSPDLRRPFGQHPETDWSPARAAYRYFMHLHAHELANAELVHGDTARLDQAMDAGSAFRGTITAVVDESESAAMKAVWTMVGPADDSLRLREDSQVCLVGSRKRKGKIRAIETDGKTRTVLVEITDGKTAKSVPGGVAADDPSLVGLEVIWLDAAGAGLSYQKTFKLGNTGPGAWLTHATPAPLPSSPGAVRPDLLQFVDSLK
jgi:hypothetical protein